jgi:hypothetical protein
MDEQERKFTIFESEFIWAYFAVGLFVVALLLRFVWGPGGMMVDQFEYQRWFVLLAAIGFGFGLGWMLFPRRLPIMHSSDDDEGEVQQS